MDSLDVWASIASFLPASDRDTLKRVSKVCRVAANVADEQYNTLFSPSVFCSNTIVQASRLQRVNVVPHNNDDSRTLSHPQFAATLSHLTMGTPRKSLHLDISFDLFDHNAELAAALLGRPWTSIQAHDDCLGLYAGSIMSLDVSMPVASFMTTHLVGTQRLTLFDRKIEQTDGALEKCFLMPELASLSLFSVITDAMMASFRGPPNMNLRELRLSHVGGCDWTFFRNVQRACPNIESFALNHSGLTANEAENIDFRLWPKLKRLDLEGNYVLQWPFNHDLPLTALLLLHTSVDSSARISEMALLPMLCSTIEELSLDIASMNNLDVPQFLGSLPNLKRLTIGFRSYLTCSDDVATQYFSYFRRLSVLRVYWPYTCKKFWQAWASKAAAVCNETLVVTI